MLHRSSLASLDDQALLQSLKTVAARASQITAALLQHFAEVEARGAYRLWASPTLQAYCTYELDFGTEHVGRCIASSGEPRKPRVIQCFSDSRR